MIVGGGFTGLWAALQAKEANPEREIVLVEATRVAEGASGRNGGFADPSLTHGLLNGLAHFPAEIEALQILGRENYRDFLSSIHRYGINAGVEENGFLSVAKSDHEIEELQEVLDAAIQFGEEATFLDSDATRSEVNSPTYVAGVLNAQGSIVDPARLAWGLCNTIRELGVHIFEQTPMLGLTRHGHGMEVRCAAGRVRAPKVLLATNAFPTPVRSMQRRKVPIWDYILMTEPVTKERLADLGWKRRQGVGEMGNQFHYSRLTEDDRILWGGYDAIYHFGSRIDQEYQQRRASFEGLADRFLITYPQLEGIRFTHAWGGPIASTTRFCLDVGTAYQGRVSWAMGYTGLGVVASRFGGRIALALLDQSDAQELKLQIVKRRPFPWPPEPFRSLVIGLTQREMARSDRNQGRRGLWLGLLDWLGLGFDS